MRRRTQRRVQGDHRVGRSANPRYARAVIRLAIVDDHPAIAAALEAAIRERAELELVGSVSTVAAAIELVDRQMPDLVVCDLWLDGEPGGLDILSTLTAPDRRHHPRVLVLSGFDQPSFLRAAFE